MVGGHWAPIDPSRMPPAIENDSAAEWRSLSRHDNAVVLPHGARSRFSPVEFNAGKLQSIEDDEQVLRPLKTEAAFPETAVHEEVIEK